MHQVRAPDTKSRPALSCEGRIIGLKYRGDRSGGGHSVIINGDGAFCFTIRTLLSLSFSLPLWVQEKKEGKKRTKKQTRDACAARFIARKFQLCSHPVATLTCTSHDTYLSARL